MPIQIKARLIDNPNGPILAISSPDYGEYYIVQLRTDGSLLRYDGLTSALFKTNSKAQILLTDEEGEEGSTD